MPLSKTSLKGKIQTELQDFAIAIGFPILNSTQLEKFAEAIANAVVDEITQNAAVVVPGGSSSGTYPVT